MERRKQLRLLPLVPCLLTCLLAGTASAQGIYFIPDFGAPQASHLQLNGATLGSWNSQIVLRLTDGGAGLESHTAYYNVAQSVSKGFTTYFAFQMHSTMNCCAPGDGFSFIVQNATATDGTQGATGSGIRAVGSEDGGEGYSGINNSLAVEFDIFEDSWDPTSNHIAVQTCGGNLSLFNSPVHLPGSYTIGNNHNVTSCLLSSGAINSHIAQLGPTCSGSSCMDGAVHQVVVEYDAPPTNQQQGTLEVFLDPTFYPYSHIPISGSQPVISVPYNIVYTLANPVGLNLSNTGQLFIGFGGSQPATGNMSGPSGGTAIDILAWEYTTHGPSQITHKIPDGEVEDDFVFGAHQFAVTYPMGFMNNDRIDMTVRATPWNQQTFFTQRLMGSGFTNENCLIYLGTGGNCIVYTVTCSKDGVLHDCPPEDEDDIASCSKFYLPGQVSNLQTDFLKADPNGSNNWCSFWNGFNPLQDPVVSGKGRGFSDIVATASPMGRGMQCMPETLEETTQRLEQQMSLSSSTNFCPAIPPSH